MVLFLAPTLRIAKGGRSASLPKSPPTGHRCRWFGSGFGAISDPGWHVTGLVAGRIGAIGSLHHHAAARAICSDYSKTFSAAFF